MKMALQRQVLVERVAISSTSINYHNELHQHNNLHGNTLPRGKLHKAHQILSVKYVDLKLRGPVLFKATTLGLVKATLVNIMS